MSLARQLLDDADNMHSSHVRMLIKAIQTAPNDEWADIYGDLLFLSVILAVRAGRQQQRTQDEINRIFSKDSTDVSSR